MILECYSSFDKGIWTSYCDTLDLSTTHKDKETSKSDLKKLIHRNIKRSNSIIPYLKYQYYVDQKNPLIELWEIKI